MCLMYDNSAYYELLIMDHVVYARRTGGEWHYLNSLEASDLFAYRATLGCSFIEGSNTRSLYVMN